MKAEELMIGDLVHSISTIHNVSFPDNGVIQDEGCTTIRTPIKITTVSENCVSYYSNKLELYITLSSEDIEPIPLTPEILKKNFTTYELEYFISEYEGHNPKLNDYFSIYYNKCTEVSSIWKTAYIEDFSGEKNSESVCITSIKYVHELQHFLKFCGIDKEILL